MDQYNVFQMKKDVNRKLHNRGNSQDFPGALDEGRRNMLQQIMAPELIRTSYIEQALYDQVDKYAVPVDLKYQDVVTINKLASYNLSDHGYGYAPLAQLYKRDFDYKFRENIFSINSSNGVKYMSIFRAYGGDSAGYGHLTIHRCDSLDSNGTWNAGGNVVNLRTDKLNYISGNGSLAFDINTSSTTGFIENFTMTEVDMYNYLEKGAAFTWLDLHDILQLQSVKITLGSNIANLTTDLYQFTVNQPHDNNQFIDGWNLLKFPLQTLSTVGTPNPRAIRYVRFDFTTLGTRTMSNMHLDNVVARKGIVFEMEYNSRYCIQDHLTKVWKKKTTSDTDIFPLEEDTYQILMLETALVVQQEVYGSTAGASADVTDIKAELKEKYAEYKRQHKAQFIGPEEFSNLYGRNHFGSIYGRDEGYGRHTHREPGWHHDSDDQIYPNDQN